MKRVASDGALLVEPRLFLRIRPQRKWFRSRRRQRIVAAMLDSWQRHGTLDVLIIAAELQRSSELRFVGRRRLAALTDRVPNVEAALAWARTQPT